MSHDEETGEVLDHKGRRLNEAGQELPDPSSLAPPIGFIKQPPLHELIRQMVRQAVLESTEDGPGTFDEEDDFDIEDEEDPTSPYEEVFEPEAPPPAPEAVTKAEESAISSQTPPVPNPPA